MGRHRKGVIVDERIFDTGDFQLYLNEYGGYTIEFESADILSGMRLVGASLLPTEDGDPMLRVILEPKDSPEDSFAYQVAKEVEEFEQLALDI